MAFTERFKQEIFNCHAGNFEDKAMEVFEYQAAINPVYKEYLERLKINPNHVQKTEDIPFLPIEFFKSHYVVSGNPSIQTLFESSGTTGQVRSRHYVADTRFYNEVSTYIFEKFYGKLTEHAFVALLPSYIERGNSSLVHMVQHFMSASGYTSKGFYLDSYNDLLLEIEKIKSLNIKPVLFGVTFALLDLAEINAKGFDGVLVIETGGMKGRRREMVREEVHAVLQKGLGLPHIASEYGMTELLSQAYANSEGVFETPAWMKVLLRDTADPFTKGYNIQRGGINVIDLANIDSCAFIETKDIGQLVENQKFKVLGRFDNAEIRGCNLMAL